MNVSRQQSRAQHEEYRHEEDATERGLRDNHHVCAGKGSEQMMRNKGSISKTISAIYEGIRAGVSTA